MKLIKLIPYEDSRFIFGDSMSEKTVIFHSDSLASAIITNQYLLGKTVNVEKFPLISSLFYGINDVLFVPVCRIKKMQSFFEKHLEDDRKIAKKTLMQSLESLKSEDLEPIKELNVVTTSAEKKYLEGMNYIYRLNSITRNSIDRESWTVKEGLFDVTFIELHPTVYLYFLMDDLGEYEEAIKLLEKTGIGGRRSQGFGKIKEVKIEDFESDEFEKEGKEYMSLSCVFFKDADEFEKARHYEIYKSKGFIGYPVWGYRRKQILGVKEGAIFEDRIEGKNFTNVSPKNVETKVHRIGKAFLIKVE